MTLKILVVEDDPKIAGIILENLNKWGYEGVVVQDFDRIHDEFIQCQPALVLLDVKTVIVHNPRRGQPNLISNRYSLIGPTGVGKTYLSCALGHAACRMDYSVRYFRISKLMEKLQIAHGDGTYFKFSNSIKRSKLLILDDWGLRPLSSNECNEILELFEDRFNTGSTIISSQLPLEHWDHALSDPTLADSILDRVVHNAQKIFFERRFNAENEI